MLHDIFLKNLLNRAGQRGPITLMYHSITPGKSKPKWRWAVSYQAFCDQLTLLQDFGWHLARASNLSNVNSLPQRTAVVTFDDGYADNFPAFEELAKRKLCASWFIVSRDIGSHSSWVRKEITPEPMLNAEQLQTMADAGMEIGSHTYTHCRLTELNDKVLDWELTASKQALSETIGRPIESFAYPYGLHNERITHAVRCAGYHVACTTRTGSGLVDHDPLRVRRLSIMAQDSLSEFARKLAFADNNIGWTGLTRYAFGRFKARLQTVLPHGQ